MRRQISKRENKSNLENKNLALAKCGCCGEDIKILDAPSLFPIQEKFLNLLNIIYGLLYFLPLAFSLLILNQINLEININPLSFFVICFFAPLMHYIFASERIKFHVLLTEKPLSCAFAYLGGCFLFFRKKDLMGILSAWLVPLLIQLAWI